jgi:thiamine-phosphate pyrophosphorylase
MGYQFTPAAERALIAASAWISCDNHDELAAGIELEPPELLLGLLSESECRAAGMLAARGVDADSVRQRWPQLKSVDSAPGRATQFSTSVEKSLAAAAACLSDYPRPLVLATEHLLLGLVAGHHETATWLAEHGFHVAELETEINRFYGHTANADPIELPEEPSRPAPAPLAKLVERAVEEMYAPLSPSPAPDSRERGIVGVLRIIDAAANRAREGLRVVEDYLRFVLDDLHLTTQFKQLRHDLTYALVPFSLAERLASRETQADVGTQVSTSAERERARLEDVLTANLKRIQEAFRSLEEYGKLIDSDAAARIEQLRYRAYTLERAVEITLTSSNRLARAQLYVLVDGRSAIDEFENLVRALVDVGTHVLQLRDKTLNDRDLLARARLLRDITADTGTLFIMNDRADLAALCGADGVHVGQEELSVKEARTIVGPRALIGVSTHSLEQARQAVLDGANYIGVGPVFPSGTKSFDTFPGLDLLRRVGVEIRLPSFAIGGITAENVLQVQAAGFTRIAVAGAVLGAPDPADAAKKLMARLRSATI